MEYEFSSAERIAAVLTVHERMVHELWVHVLSGMPEPLEEARAISAAMHRELAGSAIDEPAREVQFIERLLLPPLDAIWAGVMGELEELAQPIPYRPADGDRPFGDE